MREVSQVKAYSIPALVIATICFTLAVSDALAWTRRDKKRSGLAFLLICLGGVGFCLCCAGEYNVDDSLQSIPWLKGEVVASTISGFALLWLVAEETRLIKGRYVLGAAIWAAAASLSQFMDLGELTWVASRPFTLRVQLPFGLDFVYREVERGPVLVAITSVGFVLLVYALIVVIAFRRRGNRRESGVLMASLSFILGAQILDFFIGIGLIHFVFLLEYAWLATILVVGLQRSNDFIEAAMVRRALQETDAELKESKAVLATFVDRTVELLWTAEAERKRAEESIARSQEEKEALLREVYHRTKNNMNVIVAMLRLQSNATEDERIKAALAVSVDRIISMSMAHDMLYKTEDLSRVDLGAYLTALVKRLVSGPFSSGTNPELVLDMAGIPVSLDTAVNCGIIVNELVTNSLKYAFPEGHPGQIRIGLGKQDDGSISLELSDDGVGMAPGFDLERNSNLGLRLVNSIASGKLQARKEFSSERGCAYRLVFAAHAEY